MAAPKKEKQKGAQASLRHRKSPEPFSEALGARIRELRHEKEISFDAIVGLSELGRGYVSEVERGMAVPSVLTLCKLAGALNMSAIDLLNEVCADRPARAALINISAQLSDEGLKKLLIKARELQELELDEE